MEFKILIFITSVIPFAIASGPEAISIAYSTSPTASYSTQLLSYNSNPASSLIYPETPITAFTQLTAPTPLYNSFQTISTPSSQDNPQTEVTFRNLPTPPTTPFRIPQPLPTNPTISSRTQQVQEQQTLPAASPTIPTARNSVNQPTQRVFTSQAPSVRVFSNPAPVTELTADIPQSFVQEALVPAVQPIYYTATPSLPIPPSLLRVVPRVIGVTPAPPPVAVTPSVRLFTPSVRYTTTTRPPIVVKSNPKVAAAPAVSITIGVVTGAPPKAQADTIVSVASDSTATPVNLSPVDITPVNLAPIDVAPTSSNGVINSVSDSVSSDSVVVEAAGRSARPPVPITPRYQNNQAAASSRNIPQPAPTAPTLTPVTKTILDYEAKSDRNLPVALPTASTLLPSTRTILNYQASSQNLPVVSPTVSTLTPVNGRIVNYVAQTRNAIPLEAKASVAYNSPLLSGFPSVPYTISNAALTYSNTPDYTIQDDDLGCAFYY